MPDELDPPTRNVAATSLEAALTTLKELDEQISAEREQFAEQIASDFRKLSEMSNEIEAAHVRALASADRQRHKGGRPALWRRRDLILALADRYEAQTGERVTTTDGGEFHLLVEAYMKENAPEWNTGLLSAIKLALRTVPR
jgi:hypothetical protein